MSSRIIFRATKDEKDWLTHAARLRHLSVSEYIKEAINTRLRREGVDAVCFAVRSESSQGNRVTHAVGQCLRLKTACRVIFAGEPT